jgi:hypothetical protein
MARAVTGVLGLVLAAGVLSACASGTATKPVAVKADVQTRATPAPTSIPTTTALPPTTAATVVTTTTIVKLASRATTTLGCVMSHDPACGPMWFNPPPAPDQAVRITVTASPVHPTAGQTVTFHVVMDDPDGPIGCVQSVSDGQTSSVSDCGTSLPCDRFGAWPPPAPAPGHAQQDVTATYRRPGQYTFTIAVVPYSSGCSDARTHRGEQPYVSAGSGSLTITVT